MNQTMFPVSQEGDSLSSLEERIQRAVELVARLKQEKQAALAEAAEARAESAKMAEELRGLQSERKQVRGRIERLLEQIDELNAG